MEWDLKLLIQFREYKEMICFKKNKEIDMYYSITN